MKTLQKWLRLGRHWVWLFPLAVGFAFAAGGAYMIMEGRNAQDDVQNSIVQEGITVSDDADEFAGEQQCRRDDSRGRHFMTLS